MKWTKPEFSPDEIRQAGVILRDAVGYQGKEIPVGAQYDAPKAILNNWKASHHRPLNHLYTNLYNHTKRAIKGSDPLVSQRVKRIESILFKLRDKPAQIDLLNMQDLGGCRAIVGTMAQLRALADLQRLSPVAHQLWQPPVDYLTKPRGSGYRGIHLLYEYGASADHAEYDKMRIEIQLRTRLQHAWSTANEVISEMRGEPLKSGYGDPHWLRMFALISSAFALLEGTAPVRDTPSEMAALKREILELDEELEFRHQLASWQVAINYAQRRLGSGKQFHYFLLVLDSDAKSLTIKSYPRDQVRQAERDLEKEQDIGTFRDVVLVAAPGLKNLLKAYPNYQLDTDLFLAKLDQVLGAAA